MLRWRGGNFGNRQPDEVSIVGGIPVPVAPCGNGRQLAQAKGPVHGDGTAAEVLVGTPRRVRVDQPVERIEARRRVSEVSSDLWILPVRIS